MTGSYKLMVGGREINLRFNNFAHVELSKAIFESGYLVTSPSELVDKLVEMSKSNIGLLVKAMLYSGILGYDYEVGFKASVTQEEVGKIVGEVGEKDLLKIWDIFLEAMGVDLSDLVSRSMHTETSESENEEDLVEKKS